MDIGKKYLITCDNWFYGRNGAVYKAVYGTVLAILDDEASLGIKTNRNSTNWFVQIGNMKIAGCQIHYAIQSDDVHLGETEEWAVEAGICRKYVRPSAIYDADAQ